MKKLFFLIAAITGMLTVAAQTVGIGTVNPNSNAVLDIFSTNKGVLIPRILDTATVTSPLEGLIIYNKNTRSPYYYDGARWLSLGGRLPNNSATTTDRMTYQVTGGSFSSTEEPVYSFSHGTSNPTTISGGGLIGSNVSVSPFNYMKEFDINSKSFNMSALVGVLLPSIEFKVYATGATIPYLSYRYKNIMIESYQMSASAGAGPPIESVSIAFENYGFKDWVNNVEFGYNLVTKTITAY
jgi:type VI protein secretion system component Hcp